jgi:trans-aconitate methyltransferase
MGERWGSGEDYEPFIGRWSRPVALDFLNWLNIASKKRWLDVGCGTGALSSTILAGFEPTALLGIDPSPEYVAWASLRVKDDRARFETGDATRLPSSTADVVVSGLVLNFLPNPSLALSAMRAAAPKGVIAAYVWDYAGRMDMLRHFWDAAVALDPTALSLDEGNKFPICQRESLTALWKEAGLTDVSTRRIDVPTTFSDFEDFWNPFLGGQGPAPTYALSLGEKDRNALREMIRSRLPISSDGSIHLIARAWAVQGRSN